MKHWKVLILISMILPALTSLASSGETLYNGIVLPDQWPPKFDELVREPMPVPYLKNPPAVIPIDVGRQLFVDDFLIADSTLKRTFHQPDYCKQNPVIKPDKPWENKSRGWFAAPFSGGAWYDPADKLFKLWYTGGFLWATCYATSKDGIHWETPKLDVKEGSNVVLERSVVGEDRRLDTTTVWLDHDAKDPKERFKYFATEVSDGWGLTYRTSADGIHWSKPLAKREIWGDRTTAFYNPFRKVWVLSQRIEGYPVGRCRSYLEAASAMDLMEEATPNASRMVSVTGVVIDPDLATEDDKEMAYVEGKSVLWTNADDLDPRHTDPKFEEYEPQLYNLDAAPYESLMIGYFSIWQGPENDICGELKLQKRNDILLGFSRDGFHWDRPCRKRFISCTWDEKSWRYGNVQSVAGGCLVVGDKLYFYFSGRAKPREDDDTWDADAATGLAILRRDGFASMDAGEKTETLTTRLVTFEGKHLFVNVDCPKGELKAEVLDKDGKVIAPFDLKNCEPVSYDKTLVQVNWKQNKDIAVLAGKPVRFRFHLRNGSLYAFWVSPDYSGASGGYIGAGGPGFTGPTDTVGQSAVRTSR